MLGSQECFERAAELERRAKRAQSPELKADYLRAAEGWRDLARRAEAAEQRSDS